MKIIFKKKSELLGNSFFLWCGSPLTGLLVPPGGIEPPTQGFSVPCSTD